MVLHDFVRSIFFGTVVLAFWPSETIQDLYVVAIKRGGHGVHPLCASLGSPAFNNDVDEIHERGHAPNLEEICQA